MKMSRNPISRNQTTVLLVGAVAAAGLAYVLWPKKAVASVAPSNAALAGHWASGLSEWSFWKDGTYNGTTSDGVNACAWNGKYTLAGNTITKVGGMTGCGPVGTEAKTPDSAPLTIKSLTDTQLVLEGPGGGTYTLVDRKGY